jgi:hypothetical protein
MRGRRMPRKRKNENLPEEKKAIIELLNKVKTAAVPPTEAHAIWDEIYSYKESYIKNISSQSWNCFIGNIFEDLVYYVLKNYISELNNTKGFENIKLFTEDEIASNDFLHQKPQERFEEPSQIIPEPAHRLASPPEHDGPAHGPSSFFSGYPERARGSDAVR